jgi:hypothetical protein
MDENDKIKKNLTLIECEIGHRLINEETIG